MKILLCMNPFDLTREHRRLDLATGKSIAHLLKRYKLDEAFIVVLDGEVLSKEDGIALVPEDGDDVMLVAELKNPALRTIAMIGVQIAGAFLVPGLGNFIGGVLFQSLTTVAQNAIAGALISVAGSLAVGGIASLLQKTPGGQNYGVLGPSTTARSGLPIPKGYGLMRSGGNIVESWIDIQGNNGDQHDVDDGADTIGRQYINGRVDFGWGPASSMPNILLNNQDINSYGDVSYLIRLGTNTQGAVLATDPGWIIKNQTLTGTTQNTQPTTDFNSINNNYPQNKRVRCGIAQNYSIVPGQRDDTEKITVFVVFPQGVWRLDDDNIIKRAAIDYDVLYKETSLPTLLLADGTVDFSNWTHVAGTSNDYTSSTHYYYNIRQTLLRQATIIDNLPAGLYDIAVRKNGAGAVHNPLDYFEHESNKWGDELWVESVQETSYTTMLYRNTIQLCFRIMATDQISGSDIQFAADIEHGLRQTLPAELTGLDADTPACVVYDMLVDPLIGANWTDIDLDFLSDWAALTYTQVDRGDGTTQRLARFNGVFDQGVNVWQAISAVAVMGRANLQRIGRTVTGWLEAPDVPTQMFGMGSILKGSYEKTELGLDDRAQELQITFADVDDDYKTRNPLRLVSSTDFSAATALKKVPVSLLGCTDRVQAYYWGELHRRQNEEILYTHSFKVAAQAIRTRVGNVAWLQHDVPKYGWGGLVMPGSTASRILFDRSDQPFDSVSTWTVTVQHPALQVGAVNIAGIYGNVLTVTGYDGSTPITRVLQGNVDVAVTKAVSGAITVEDATGLVAGAAQLWNTDMFETSTVTSLKGNVATLATPLSAVPQDYTQFIYQSSVVQAALVRIKGIKRDTGKMHATITAIDYSGPLYDIPAPVGLAAS